MMMMMMMMEITMTTMTMMLAVYRRSTACRGPLGDQQMISAEATATVYPLNEHVGVKKIPMTSSTILQHFNRNVNAELMLDV